MKSKLSKKQLLIQKVIAKSPWVTHLNTGSCNGCDIEILACLTPRYDVERLGITLRASPRQADAILATGPVNYQTIERIKNIYEQVPDPKVVIAVGTCACTGGVFQECFNVLGGIDKVIPVDIYILGCPPRPEAIIDGVMKLIKILNQSAKEDNCQKIKKKILNKFNRFLYRKKNKEESNYATT